MAETVSPEMNCVYVETNLDTRLVVLVHSHETISDFKEKLCKEHHQCFPKLGEINISAVKVKHRRTLDLRLDFHLPDSMLLSMAFKGASRNCWLVFVDASVRIVDTCQLPDAAKNCVNLELVEKDKGIATDSLLLNGDPKNQNPEEDLETGVAEMTTKKRKLELSSDGEKSGKKPKVDADLSLSAAAAAASSSRLDVDESHVLSGNVLVEVFSAREKQDEAKGKEIEVGEKSLEDEARDNVESDKLVSHTTHHLDSKSGLATRPDTEKEKKRKKRSKNESSAAAITEKEKKRKKRSKIESSAAAITTSRVTVNEIDGVPANVEHVDASPQSLPSPNLDNSSEEARQKENDMGENFVEDLGKDKIETDNVVSHMEDPLASKGDTEKKNKRKKRSKNESSAAAITEKKNKRKKRSKEYINQSSATPESLPISKGDNLHVPFAEATQKENEMGDDTCIDDVGRDTGNLGSHTANRLDTNSVSNEDINQASAAGLTTSRDMVNENNRVPANVDFVEDSFESLPVPREHPFAEASQKDIDHMGDDDVGRDQSETGNLVSHTADHFDINSELTTRPDTEKKRKEKKKRSKDGFSPSITTSRDILNEINEVPANVDATPESLPISRGTPFVAESKNEMAEVFAEDVGRDNIATRPDTENSSKDDFKQSFAATTASEGIVNEINGVPVNEDPVGGGALLEHLSISRRENLVIPSAEASHKETETREKIDDIVGGGIAVPSAADNTQPCNVEIDADEAKFVKPTLVVASAAHGVEAIKAVDGEEPANVTRNVLGSLQEMDVTTEENLEKTGKKPSKKQVAKSQVLSVEVNSTASPINSTKDTDATEIDASLLKKCSEVADNAEENGDMGDNFGCSQNQEKPDQVGGGVKSKEEKSGLDLHPCGSISVSLSSLKPKERKSTVQQSAASSSTYRVQSRVKSVRRESIRAQSQPDKDDDSPVDCVPDSESL